MDADINKGEFKTINSFSKASTPDATDGRFLGYIEGYASTSHVDRENDIIDKSALMKASQQLLHNSTVFFNHAHKELPLGVVVDSKYITDKGLYVKVGISKNHPTIWQSIQEGSLKYFSVAGKFNPATIERIQKEGSTEQLRVIKDVDLYEVSIVGVPANPQAEFGIIEAAKMFNPISSPPVTEGIIMPDEKPTVTESKPSVPSTPESKQPEVAQKLTELENTVATLQKKLAEEEQIKKEAQLQAEQREREEFQKWKEMEAKKTAPEVVKSTLPRTTVMREEPKNNMSMKSQNEIYVEQMEAFVKALKEPGDVDIDMYGTRTGKPYNTEPTRRESRKLR